MGLRTAIFLLLAFAPSTLRACSCVSVGNGCGSSWTSEEGAVFLGKVTAKISLARPDNGLYDLSAGYAVHFSVTESFHGVNDPADTVVYTGSGSGDCGYPFGVGTSYLVYASSYNGRLSTSICSGTNPEVRVAGLLKQLRAVRDTGHGYDLFGAIVAWPTARGYVDLSESQALPDVSVRVTSAHGALSSAKSDEHGAYVIACLPPDTYRVEPELSAGWSITQGTERKPFLITAADKPLAGFGCQVDLFPRPDGQISGTVMAPDGKGVPGFVTIQPADPKEAQAAWHRGGLPGDDTTDGKFLLPQLPPGRYRLVFHPKAARGIDFRRTFYWPLSGSRVELVLGQHLDDVRFDIPLSASPP